MLRRFTDFLKFIIKGEDYARRSILIRFTTVISKSDFD